MTVLGLGSLCTFVPVIMMMILAVFLNIHVKDWKITGEIADLCATQVGSSALLDVNINELVLSCVEENTNYLHRSVIWAIVRTAIQVNFLKIKG